MLRLYAQLGGTLNTFPKHHENDRRWVVPLQYSTAARNLQHRSCAWNSRLRWSGNAPQAVWYNGCEGRRLGDRRPA